MLEQTQLNFDAEQKSDHSAQHLGRLTPLPGNQTDEKPLSETAGLITQIVQGSYFLLAPSNTPGSVRIVARDFRWIPKPLGPYTFFLLLLNLRPTIQKSDYDVPRSQSGLTLKISLYCFYWFSFSAPQGQPQLEKPASKPVLFEQNFQKTRS